MLGSTIYQPTHNSLVEQVSQRSALFGFCVKPRFLPNPFTLYAFTYLFTGDVISKNILVVLQIRLHVYTYSVEILKMLLATRILCDIQLYFRNIFNQLNTTNRHVIAIHILELGCKQWQYLLNHVCNFAEHFCEFTQHWTAIPYGSLQILPQTFGQIL